MTETNRIEFKRELSETLDLEKEVVAFLNYREGGTIYIGIDDDGTPIGVKDLDGDMLKIKDRIRKNIYPSPLGLFDVTIETIDGVKVIKIFMATGSEKPYYKAKYGMSTKGCFIRVGTAAEPMTTSMIEDLFSHRVRNSLSRITSLRQDLTFRQLHIYYESKGLHLNENFAKNLELLTPDGKYNYAAYLLADENGNSIKLAKYAGTDRCDLISNNEYGYCSLLKATDSILDKLHVENTVTTKITYPYRIDKTLWDRTAMRELVINAIVHNDYSNEVPPKFEIFSDRVEITSAGRLPEGMDLDDFFGGVSNPRNKELMRIFRDVEMVEALGSGMPRILEKYGRECFEFLPNFIRIVIPFNNNSELTETSDKPQRITNKKQVVLDYIIAHPGVQARYIAKYFDFTEDVVKKSIKILMSEKLIVHKGSRKDGGYYDMNVWDDSLERTLNGTLNGTLNDTLNNILNSNVLNNNTLQNVGSLQSGLQSGENVGSLSEVCKDNVGSLTEECRKFDGNKSKIQLTDRQKLILKLIKHNPMVSAKAMSEVLSVTRRTVERDIAVLQKKGIIRRNGKTSGGHWEVIM